MSSKWSRVITGTIMVSVIAQAACLDGTFMAKVSAVVLTLAAFFCGMTLGFNFAVARKEVQ